MQLPKILAPGKWMFLPPVVLGGVVLLISFSKSARLEPAPFSERWRTLRVIAVPETEFVPRVLGYGAARPEKVWRAVAEVQGKLSYVDPELRAGAMVVKGVKLLTIDKTEYVLIHEYIVQGAVYLA